MADIEARVQELAELMDEFQLSEAELGGDGWKVGFRRHAHGNPGTVVHVATLDEALEHAQSPAYEAAPHPPGNSQPAASFKPAGEPLESPMNGIYYSAPSPNAPPFCKEGEEVEEGQVLALIEAMKVFNEIVAPNAGRVTGLMHQNAQLVQTGDVLLYLEALG